MKVATENDGKTTVERLSKQETRTFANAKSIASQIFWHEDDRSYLAIKASEIDEALGYILAEFAKRKEPVEAEVVPAGEPKNAN